MLHITDNVNQNDIYSFHLSFETPYFFEVSFEEWKKSLENDIDGEGRILFKELYLKAVYDDSELQGFVQYGKLHLALLKAERFRRRYPTM